MRAKNSVYYPLYVRREAFIAYNNDVKNFKISMIDYGKFLTVLFLNSPLVKEIRAVDDGNISIAEDAINNIGL
jgi:hypothetical protein